MMDLRGLLQRGLGDTYSIERELVAGGMSRVFVATEASLDRRVVIKVLAPELMLGVSAERFKREIALAAHLQHPHVVALLSAGEAIDPVTGLSLPYYTMPFVEGQSLRARLTEAGTLSPAESIGILRDVAKALAYAHDHGVVHRDIKPDNILLSGTSAAVTDFGVAKAIDESRADVDPLTGPGILGTNGYLSPEQAGSASVDHRTDIYSFGVTAYEMLAGHLPPPHGSADHIGELRPATPPLLAELVMRCLERDPAARPQSAAGIVTVLDNVTSGNVDAAEFAPRRRARWTAIVAVAAVIIVAGAFTTRLLSNRHFASGALAENDRVLVGDFRSTSGNRTLATVVTEAFRTSLGQSRSLTVVPMSTVFGALQRMQRDRSTPVNGSVARELATREGVKAFVDGEIISAGGRNVVSVQLVETATGENLATLQETAADEHDLLPAVDKLTARLRERAGESLKQIRETPPLDQVTTPSFDALRAYVAGTRALSFDGDFERGRMLLEEAISIDTTFSMAYRKLAVELDNRRIDPDRSAEYLTKAYRHRDHLTEAERYLTIGSYFSFGPQSDIPAAISAYEHLAELYPQNANALNNAASVLRWAKKCEQANIYLRRVTTLPDAFAASFWNAGYVGICLGDTAETWNAVHVLESRFAQNTTSRQVRGMLLYGLGFPDSALALSRWSVNGTGDPLARSSGARVAAGILASRGKIDEASQMLTRAALLRGQGGDRDLLTRALDSVWVLVVLRGDTAAGRRALDRALAAHPLKSLPHLLRPYIGTVRLLTLVGHVGEAKAVVALFDRERASVRGLRDDRFRHSMAADIAMAEHRYADAAREYRLVSESVGPCIVCSWPGEARALDLSGQTDSAMTIYTRYLNTRDAWSTDEADATILTDATYLASTYLRLGELWEAKGDRVRAATYYNRYLDLLKNADPELQANVTAVRRKVAALK